MPRAAEAAWAAGGRAQRIMLPCSSLAVPVIPDEVMVTQPSERENVKETHPRSDQLDSESAASVNYTSSLESGRLFQNYPPTPPHGDEKPEVRNEPPEGS